MNKKRLSYAVILICLLCIIVIAMIITHNENYGKGNSPLPGGGSGSNSLPTQPIYPTMIPVPSNPAYQGQADKNSGDEATAIYNSYPWLDKFPLQTDSYFFYFDLNKKAFIGKLYPQKSSNESVTDQVAAVKQQILSILTSYGIDSTKYTITWTILEK